MTAQGRITLLVAAVAPIDGISFGKFDDKTTWAIQFKPEATQAEIYASHAVIDNIENELEKQGIIDEIDALERTYMMPRASREFMLTFMEAQAIAAGAARIPPLDCSQSIVALRAGNLGYSRVKDLDEQIAALRAQL